MNVDFIREVGPLRWLLRTVQRQLHKRVLRRSHRMRLPTGNHFTLPIESFLASEVFVTGANIDWGSEALLASLVDGQGSFLDVGANIGYYSVYFQPLFERVFAFEPDPRPREHLEANAAQFDNIEVVPLVVARVGGTASFTLSEASEVSHIATAGERGAELAATSIDNFVAERGIRVAAIKTDVEGHDFDVLQGASSVLRAQRPIVLSELQPSKEVVRFAASVDYEILAFARQAHSRTISFARPADAGRQDLVYKMLFLVPRERSAEVLAAANAKSS